MIKVSILVPIYKCEKYIRRCAESLFSQIFDDVEFIFYDDCSPDNSVVILKDCLQKYPNRKEQVRIITGERNIGVAAARNRLLCEAVGEYIWYIDSDDWIEAGAIQLLYDTAFNLEADIISLDFYIESLSRSTIRSFTYKSASECLKDVIGSNWGVVWRFFFKRAIAIDNSITFPLSYQGGEDYVFCVKYLFYAKKIFSLNAILYHYVTYNSMSLITQKDISNLIHQYETTLIVEKFLFENNVLQLYSKELDLRKSYVISSFSDYFNNKWGRLYWSRWNRILKQYKQKFINCCRIIIEKYHDVL